jgi:DNA-binding IclR family transcriptional regulator
VLFAYQNASGRAAMRALQASKGDRERWSAIEREAKTIREMGFFLSPSPYVDAVTDIAAPVTMGAGQLAVAALVMPFIGGRSAKLSLTQAATATREAAQRISRELG